MLKALDAYLDQLYPKVLVRGKAGDEARQLWQWLHELCNLKKPPKPKLNAAPLTNLAPRRTFMVGYACPQCGQVFTSATLPTASMDQHLQESAKLCCGPWVCRDCGHTKVKGRAEQCAGCRAITAAKAYTAMPEADPGDAMILANDHWYGNLGEFLDHCYCEDVEPASLSPVIGKKVGFTAPELYDHHEEDRSEDGALPGFIEDAQKMLDAFYAMHGDARWYTQGNTKPADLPTLAEMHAENDKIDAERNLNP